MTQEEKELLLKDLCARLPYGVKLRYVEDLVVKKESHIITLNNIYLEHIINGDADIKPYLRPMSSMTEYDKKEIKEATCPEGTGYFDEKYLICPINHYGEHISYEFMTAILEWLNSHHFDYRGLIEKGLALEAPKDMYITKIK